MLSSSSKPIFLFLATFSIIFKSTHTSPLILSSSSLPSIETSNLPSHHHTRGVIKMDVREHRIIPGNLVGTYRCFPEQKKRMLSTTFYATEIASFAPNRQIELDYFRDSQHAITAAKIKAITNPADKGKLTWSFADKGRGYLTFCAKNGNVDLAPRVREFDLANDFLERVCGSRVAGAVGMQYVDEKNQKLPGVEVVYGRESLVDGQPSLINCADFV